MFRKGQKLVFVDDRGNWTDYLGRVVSGISPKIGEVVTCGGVPDEYPECIIIEEYMYDGELRQCFKAWRFRPLIADSCIDELVTKEEVKETSDLTIKVPELV